MQVEIEEWKNGYYGISIGIDPNEMDEFIELLKMIKEDHDQHFHIRSNSNGTGRVGDITFFTTGKDEKHNMSLSGRAYLPGETIDI